MSPKKTIRQAVKNAIGLLPGQLKPRRSLVADVFRQSVPDTQ